MNGAYKIGDRIMWSPRSENRVYEGIVDDLQVVTNNVTGIRETRYEVDIIGIPDNFAFVYHSMTFPPEYRWIEELVKL